MMTIFIRLLGSSDKVAGLIESSNAFREGNQSENTYSLDAKSFNELPSASFAYWVSDHIRNIFRSKRSFESDETGVVARRGVNSNDDFRFLRSWLEVSSKSKRWISHPKGGAYNHFYSDIDLVVDWHLDGSYLKAERVTNRVYAFAIVPSRDLYFRPGLTWTRRTSRDLSMRALPRGCIFADKGPAAFATGDDPDVLLALCAISNSRAYGVLVSLQLAAADAAARSYEVGVIQKTPVPYLSSTQQATLAALSRRVWSLQRTLNTVEETSHAFYLPSALRARLGFYDPSIIESDVAKIRSEIDDIAFDIYGFTDEDRSKALRAIEETTEAISEEDDDDTKAPIDQTDALLSWAVGVAFGRFDLRLATGEREAPLEPDPFDPLPTKSPAMVPEGAKQFYDHAGFMVDDPGHPHDLARLVEEVLVRVNAAIESDIRTWLRREFFDCHLKRYSKSKRKSPIYWRISTTSGLYSIWLYASDANKDSFFQLYQDVLGPKIASEERALVDLTKGSREHSSRDRLEIENQQKLVEELRQLAGEVKRVAPLWNPNLDDGTVLVMASLWRMVGRHKQWQKELRTRWEELQSGKHDWSHQAMHLWPERVVPKCAEDRSLAIAHDLGDVFWIEAESGKWAKRDVPTRSVEEIVRERTSDAVKAALKELLEAPEPAATGSRSRRRA